MALGSTKKSVVASLISGDRSKAQGVLCSDTTGLCLVSEGTMKGDAGSYASLVRLASQLSPQAEGNMPLITLESESFAVLVKEYDGRTVAIQVPSDSTQGTRAQSRSTAEAPFE